ncbi:MAG TPA: hypothetical protein VH396_16240 [Chitinophagaceae bacterium]|jgi:hypothetical protein
MTGYSGTPLLKKLGIKEEHRVKLVKAPVDYMEFLEVNIEKQLVDKIYEADLVHLFVATKADLKKEFARIIQQAKDGLIIWISWYKKSSGISTDVTEDTIREIVLPTGWVDVKVCAVNDIWSGLKIVKRKNK